ncbi:sigma-54-dependent Fis family transcriptional regulator [Desulfonatronovibrio magnus]|uniref:sigma-54-dependent Fis family transcriptional regulator n=1 Tax=Desulfonatronovibrio magnus TaxID=698827 RepID=UPI0005EB7123|nr:sigma 54-interacting transcriptional regulator [Desulfonatronovibrio magnus]RQD65500.1 MAG: AAA family ATPase [Desulfonatronovibrio sp. MSAO_Bac4]
MSDNTQLIILEKILMELGWQGPLREGLEKLLKVTSREMGYKRMSLAIFDPKSQSIEFSLSYGHKKTPKYSYTPGQGITGLVVKERSPITVPVMKDDPNFLNLAFDRSPEELASLSFISVPIKRINPDNEMEILGVLNAEMGLKNISELETDCRFLQILGIIIARQASFLQEEMTRQKEFAGFLPVDHCVTYQDLAKNKLIASSKIMMAIMNQIMQVAPSKATVLVRGESGTGKELLAEAIHNLSPRKSKPFVKLNCAALPSELLESELFGYEKGAFTGAVSHKKGRFELAHQGTLFLDEIGELSADAQAKLLRAIQEGEFQRLGSEKTTQVNVRIVCATHQLLENLIKEGRFREDLYYRINVFPIFIPALRERREDILPIAEHFLESSSKEYEKQIKRISTPAMDLLSQYHWPGNVRELKNCIERSVLLCNEEVIRTYHLPPTLQTAESTATDNELPFVETVAKFEQELIIEALKKAAGNMLQAARDLRVSYRIINYKVKKYNINPKRYAGK